MNNKEILDAEERINYNRFRILPLVLELVPFLIGMVGWVMYKSSMEFGSELMTVGFCTLAMIYVGLCWFLFKGLKYSIWDVLAALFFGMGLSVVVLGLLFYLQNWPYKEEMVICGDCTLILCLGLSFILMLVEKITWPQTFEYEFTMSQKIFSRLLFYKLLYTVLGMNVYLLDLFFN